MRDRKQRFDIVLGVLCVVSVLCMHRVNGTRLVDEHQNMITSSGTPTCRAHTRCGACTADPNCGWCTKSMLCVEGKRRGPIMSEQYPCPVNKWRFQSRDCGVGCRANDSCESCLSRPSCGWCAVQEDHLKNSRYKRNGGICIDGNSGGPTLRNVRDSASFFDDPDAVKSYEMCGKNMDALNAFNAQWSHSSSKGCPAPPSSNNETHGLREELKARRDMPIGITLVHTAGIPQARTERKLRRILSRVLQVPLARTEIFINGVQREEEEDDDSQEKKESAPIDENKKKLTMDIIFSVKSVTMEESKKIIRTLDESFKSGALDAMLESAEVPLLIKEAHIHALKSTGIDSRHIESETWPLPPQIMVTDRLWPEEAEPAPTTTEAPRVPDLPTPMVGEPFQAGLSGTMHNKRFRTENSVVKSGDDSATDNDVETLRDFLRERFERATAAPGLSEDQKALLVENFQRIDGCLEMGTVSPSECMESTGSARRTPGYSPRSEASGEGSLLSDEEARADGRAGSGDDLY